MSVCSQVLQASYLKKQSVNQSLNQFICRLKSKQQNDNEQEQSLGVNWTQKEVSLHWRVPRLHIEKSKYNIIIYLQLIYGYLQNLHTPYILSWK